MAIDSNDRYDAAVVVSWLRRCQDDSPLACGCRRCPFGGEERCIGCLRRRAAELIERFAGEAEKQQIIASTNDSDPGVAEAAFLVTWLRNCSEKDKIKKWCSKCPLDDGEHNCMDWLQSRAADLLEKLAKESKDWR